MTAERPEKRERGSGSIFRNKGSSIWHIKYYSRGIPQRESSGSSDPQVAERLLKRRLAEVMVGNHVPTRRNIRVDELIDDVLADHKDNGRKSTGHVETRWKLHLKKHFTRLRACDLTTQHLRRYIAIRRDQESASVATINRELALLRRAYKLAEQSTPPKVTTVPHFPMLKESNVRKGFVESEQYDRLSTECAKVGFVDAGNIRSWFHVRMAPA